MNKKIRTIIIASVINMLMVAGVFLIHYTFPSIINNLKQNPALPWHHIDNQYLSEWWGFHYGHPVFSGRPVTTFVTGLISNIFHIGLGTSFVAVSFGCLFLCGVLIFFLARLFVVSDDRDMVNRVSTVSSILFFTSFSIFFSFFRPINSFDEPLQYVAILLTLFFLQKKQYVGATFSLTVAILVRETTVLLFPSLLLLIYNSSSLRAIWSRVVQNKKESISVAALFILPIIVYSILIPIILSSRRTLDAAGEYLAHDRFAQWRYNFFNGQYAVESIISAIAVLLIPCLIVGIYRKLGRASKEEMTNLNAGLVALVINTPMVFVFALAQEARLFALPLLLWWPMLGKMAMAVMKEVVQLWKKWVLFYTGFFIAWILLDYFIAFHLYQPTFSGGSGWLYQGYVFLVLAVGGFLVRGCGGLRRERDCLKVIAWRP